MCRTEPELSEIRNLFHAIVSARFLPDDQKTQAIALSLCLAEVMDNPMTPGELYHEIGDRLTDIQNAPNADAILRTTGLVPGLMVMAAREEKGESKSVSEILSASESKEDQLARYQNAADLLVAFMEDETTPAGLKDAVSEAVIDFVNNNDGTNTGVEVARFQLAHAMEKAAAASEEAEAN